jgi:glycosyltransferase involved in cell wall biosynthesis
MTIAYILSDFPIFSETFVGDEMRAMQARGHTLVPIVIQAQREAGQDADKELAASAFRLPAISQRLALFALRFARPSAFRALAFLRAQKLLPAKSLLGNALKIAAIAGRHGASHLHAHFSGGAAAHAIVAARLTGASVSFICHGHDVYSESEDLPAKLKAADFVIATCADMAADLRAMAPGATIVLSYCGIDPDKFPLQTALQTNGKLLFIGRLVEQKGIDDIIDALAAIAPEQRRPIDIVGDGPQRGELEILAREKGLLGSAVTFLGPKQRSWFAGNGPAYAALVAPFKTGPKGERDSGPMVIKEAMAMGLPVIASRYMGVKEMVAPGTGLLFDPGDVAGIVRAIETVQCWTPEERRTLQARARAHIEQVFTLEKQAVELSSFIASAQSKLKSNANKSKSSFSLNAASSFYGKYFHKP